MYVALKDISDAPKAIEEIQGLIDKLLDMEVRGSLEEWQIAILVAEIDQFSYDYDTYLYRDTVEDREAQVANKYYGGHQNRKYGLSE